MRENRFDYAIVLRTVLVVVGVAIGLYLVWLVRKPLLWVLMAVFLPVSFMTGDTGRLFGEFGVTVAAAVGFSAFIAL